MIYIEHQLSLFKKYKNKTAIIYKSKSFKYSDLLDLFNKSIEIFEKNVSSQKKIITLCSDFSPASIAMLLVLIYKSKIVIPISITLNENQINDFNKISEAETQIKIDDNDSIEFKNLDIISNHELYSNLKKKNIPGLVLFSSGSSGKPKAILHDFNKLLQKFIKLKKSLKIITFLLFDHIGGINTLFSILSNCGTIVTIHNRKVDTVCEYIEKYKVEVLPTSPTFLNMLMISESYKKYDLSSLKLITYGTEVMNDHVLKKINQIFPKIKFKQTYGLSEVGILSSVSKSNNSLWVKLGGAGYLTRIVNNCLEIKADSSMIGYLNAPSPFTNDGWFITRDEVIVDGEFLKILGRSSDIINVAGEKVYPNEIENIIMEIDGVADVTVKGEPNPIIGNIICAYIILTTNEKSSDFKKRMNLALRGNIENFKIPQKIIITKDSFTNWRYKKVRN